MDLFFFILISSWLYLPVTATDTNSSTDTVCPLFKNAPILNIKDLVGSWMTVYSQPKAVKCFTLHIRSTTDMEREQSMVKYGNFSGRVDWNYCLLEMESPLGKHYLQGNGSNAGLLENIIISENKNGGYKLQEQNADQWTIFGRRGSELLLMRDCKGEAAAVFARAPYWPSTSELYGVLHRSSITAFTQERVLCDRPDFPSQKCSMNNHKP